MLSKPIENRATPEKFERLENNFACGNISRRDFITAAVALGVSLSAASALLTEAEAAKSKRGENIMGEQEDKEKYACPHCGCNEYLTALNAYDVYVAMDDKLHFQSHEIADDEIQLFCRDCAERAPAEFENDCVT